MYYHIELTPKKELPDNVVELLWQFLASLVQNGQILKDEYTIFHNGNYYLAVTTPKVDSLEEKFDGPYVRRDREKLQAFFDLRLIPMGENRNSQEYCRCESHPAIEMETCRGDIDSPFVCCGCGKPIALYALPYPLDRDTYFETLCWQDDYSAMVLLWMRCLCDRYTSNQLVNPDSALNKLGRALARDLHEKLDIPVYYHMFDDGRKKIRFTEDGQHRLCPVCEVPMHSLPVDDYEIDICEKCGLSSG